MDNITRWLHPIEFCNDPQPWTLTDPNVPRCQEKPGNPNIKCMTYVCKHCHPERTLQYCRNCNQKLSDHPKSPKGPKNSKGSKNS